MMKQPVRTNMSDYIKSMMGSQFVIPVYQRNYTWNPNVETSRLLNDLEDLLAKKTNAHFLGILIYMETEVGAMYREIQIVDGQQRLTTSFILLLVLKRIALERNEKEIAGMIDDYYLYNRHITDQAKLRLKPMVSDDDVYAKLVYGSEKDLSRREKESNVYRNYDYIYRRMLEVVKKYPLLTVLDVLSRIDILAFPLSDNDNAQQIFESINSTGAPLTSADLIRNYILMNDASEVQERNYRLYWQPLEKYCTDSRRLEEFFRYYIAAKTYNLLSKRDVYQGFKDFWNASKESREARMQEMNRYCRYYHEIYAGPVENAEAETVLKDFRKNESRLPAPFFMEMLKLHESGEISTKDLCKIIRLVDSYLVRRALCGNETGPLSRYFPQLLRSVISARKKNPRRNISDIVKVNLIRYNRGKALAMPTDEVLRSQLREINAYSLMCIRPVLERIEHDGATAEVDTSNLNIEHIMPQHPNNYWKKAAHTKNDDEYTFYANLIGNLTLCAEYDNTRMGNQDFAFKKKILSKTLHIRMNTEILAKDSWTPQDILDRCDRLASQIIRLYPYEDTTSAPVEDDRDDDIIVISTPTVNARAIWHVPNSAEILSGSTMKAYGPQEMKTMRVLFSDLLETGVLSEAEDGRIQFDRNYRFQDLNTAAQFLLHRGGDNISAWTHENGSELFTKKPAEVKEETVKKNSTPEKKNNPSEKKNSAPEKKNSSPEKKKQQPKRSNNNNSSTQKKKKENQPSGNRQPQKKQQNTPKKESQGKTEVRVIQAKKKEEPAVKAPEQAPVHAAPAVTEAKKPEDKKGLIRRFFGKSQSRSE